MYADNYEKPKLKTSCNQVSFPDWMLRSGIYCYLKQVRSKVSGVKTHYLQCHSGHFFSGYLMGSGSPLEELCALILKGDLCASAPPKQY